MPYPGSDKGTNATVPISRTNEYVALPATRHPEGRINNLGQLIIPPHLQRLEGYKFCPIVKVVIPHSVQEISRSAFLGCRSLKFVFMRYGIKTIGESAFGDCENLKYINIPASVINIQEDAFKQCVNLSLILVATRRQEETLKKIIPNHNAMVICCLAGLAQSHYTIQSFGQKTDGMLRDYGQIEIETSGQNFPDTPCFLSKYQLVSATLGIYHPLNIVKYIKGEAINWELNQVGDIVESDCVHGRAIDSVIPCNQIDFYTLYTLFSHSESISGGKIQHDYKSDVISYQEEIKRSRVAYRSHQRDVYLKIENSVIAKCDYNATAVNIPQHIKHIAREAFNDCNKLPELRVPDGVETIGELALGGCDQLSCLYLPRSVREIGAAAFYCCEGLKQVAILGRGKIGKEAFTYCRKLKCVFISDGITFIGEKVFSYCEELQCISIPASVNHIGAEAFYDCRKLELVLYATKKQENMIKASFNDGTISICLEAYIQQCNRRDAKDNLIPTNSGAMIGEHIEAMLLAFTQSRSNRSQQQLSEKDYPHTPYQLIASILGIYEPAKIVDFITGTYVPESLRSLSCVQAMRLGVYDEKALPLEKHGPGVLAPVYKVLALKNNDWRSDLNCYMKHLGKPKRIRVTHV